MLDLLLSVIGDMDMRRAVTLLTFALWASSSTVAYPAYVIKLKNGNEYITARYWQEGTQLLFDAEGGVFGIDKAFVSNIEKTDKVVKLITSANPDSMDKPDAALKETAKDDASKDAPADVSKSPVAKDENDPVYKEFSALKAQSDGVRTMSRSELDEYVKTIAGLMSKIQKERRTNQYRQEYSELNALANDVEQEIKSRR